MSHELVVIIVPESVREIGNRIAIIFDPDSGGAQTFGALASVSGALPATHRVASVPIAVEHLPVLTQPPAEAFAALGLLAQERGRIVDFSEADVATLQSAMIVGVGAQAEMMLATLGLQWVKQDVLGLGL